MKHNLLILMTCLLLAANLALAQGGFEQYAYFNKGNVTLVPILYYQSFTKWYVEARYNYEEHNATSLYAGKVFSRKGKMSYSVTPLVGVVVGQFKGGSTGINLTMDNKKFFFATQSQYTHSSVSEKPSFFFSWSELAWQPADWFHAGLALQYTRPVGERALVEPGVVIGYSHGIWTFPMYAFSPGSNNRYFIVGVNLRLGEGIIESHLK